MIAVGIDWYIIYINTSGNWENEKLCGNTTPAGRGIFTQF
jgi:hypothetical protein